MTNPLVLYLWNGVEDKQDALLNTWILAWTGHALVTSPLELFQSNIFYPYPNTLAFSELLLPVGLLALPLTLATDNPIFSYNLALLAMLWLDAFAMYLFVFELARRAEAGWVAGALYAFNAFNLGNLAQLQLVTLGWLPLALLFLHRLLTSTDRKLFDALLLAFFFVLEALSSFYYALLSGLAVAVYLGWWLWTVRGDVPRALRRSVGYLLLSGVLIAVAVTPFVLPYFDVQRELGFQRRVQESEPFSASLRQFVQVSPQNVIYGRWLAPNPVLRVGGYPLDNLFPGIVAIALALGGLVLSRSRGRGLFLALLLIAFLLALGPRLYLTPREPLDVVLPYRWLYDNFPLLRALRAPIRFDALISLALAGLAGLGAAAMLERFAPPSSAGRVRGSGVALALVALVALESLAIPAAHAVALPVADEIPPVTRWLARQPHTVVLELPMMGPDPQGELDITTQYLTAYHWHATPDGYSGFVPPRRGEIAYEMQSFPSPRAISLLRALGVRYVVEHNAAQPCREFAGPAGANTPAVLDPIDDACIYEIPLEGRRPPDLETSLYVPSSVAAGAPFTAYLILVNHADDPFAVRPTDRAQVQAEWSDGRIEMLSFPLPLVTSRVSIVPVSMTAPSRAGDYQVSLQALDPLIGMVDTTTAVRVGTEPAREVVIPASVELGQPLPQTAARGATLPVHLRWLALNKINAYYSASLRLVNQTGDKVANLDRQPVPPTLLWRPEEAVEDVFELPIPSDTAPGRYGVQLLMYQADTGEDVLLLNAWEKPQAVVALGEVEVR